jgi:hypothetical protein
MMLIFSIGTGNCTSQIKQAQGQTSVIQGSGESNLQNVFPRFVQTIGLLLAILILFCFLIVKILMYLC